MRQQGLLACFVLVGSLWTRAVGAQTASVQADYVQHIRPVLQRLCFDCHGDGADEGGVQLDAGEADDDFLRNRNLWGKVWDNVLTETMPPADMPQPTDAERQRLSQWIGQAVFDVDREHPDPGRVTIRRLNRVEYRYAVLDLLGIDFPVYEHFPADDTGYGFDTIGDVLTVPPTLMEKYFLAAEEISQQVRTQAADESSLVFQRVFAGTEQQRSSNNTDREISNTIRRLATRAFRQPVDDATVARLVALAQPRDAEQSSPGEQVSRAVEAVLVSPRFIYRAEFQPTPDDPLTIHPLDEYALASRLSFLLWCSVPDEQLLRLASKGRLRSELPQQIARMISDSKSDRFVDNFVGQWLQTRLVEGIHRGKELTEVVRHYRTELVKETHRFFEHIMREDRDVMELLTADYSFLNSYLAKFYGIDGVEGDDFRLVKFPSDSPRGGLLTHASILMITSNPDRTSPVKRGQFVLDNFLGSPSPPAPPEVPALEEVTKGVSWHISMREQLAIHREDPGCASCHDRMDPLGLGLENFDAVGRWRDTDDGFEIDATGELVSGEKFAGVRELREILGGKRRLFYRCLTKKLMTYALGRGIEYTDLPAVEEIVDRMMVEDDSGSQGRFSTLLTAIVESPQFQLRRGNRVANN